MTRDKKRKGRKRRKRTIERQWATLTSARSGTQTALHPTPTMRDLLLPPSTSPPSSPTSDILCLMAKEKKVPTQDTPKYTSSSDEDSDDELDYSDIFKGLDRSNIDKINKLIDALNEKDRLLEKQEDSLYEEHDKCVNAEKSLAIEIKKNEIMSSELSSCHESISSLKGLNADLNARIEKLNVASPSLEHVSICNRCKDFDIYACNNHVSTVSKLNDEVANLTAQLKICKN
jgi:vacuolar-type H+-ATPase subunit I/STV1